MKVKLEEGQRKGNEGWWDECHVASLYPWALWLGNLSFKMQLNDNLSLYLFKSILAEIQPQIQNCSGKKLSAVQT